MGLRVGTSGFSYPGWRGTFYEEGAKPKDFLRLYAARLGTVELNGTFYQTPKAEVVAGWANEVPEGFRFSVKANRRITHIKRLKDCAEPLNQFLEALKPLGERLGIVLFQLPPNLKVDPERLAEFLRLLPDGTYAFEFRHPSWYTDEILAMLRAKEITVVVSDEIEPFAEIFSRNPFADSRIHYVRMRKESYSEAELRALVAVLPKETGEETFLYAKHEVTGPALAAKVHELFLETEGSGGAPLQHFDGASKPLRSGSATPSEKKPRARAKRTPGSAVARKTK